MIEKWTNKIQSWIFVSRSRDALPLASFFELLFLSPHPASLLLKRNNIKKGHRCLFFPTEEKKKKHTHPISFSSLIVNHVSLRLTAITYYSCFFYLPIDILFFVLFWLDIRSENVSTCDFSIYLFFLLVVPVVQIMEREKNKNKSLSQYSIFWSKSIYFIFFVFSIRKNIFF